jgi:acyl dehydratase
VPGYLTLVFAEGLFSLSGRMHHAVGLLSLDEVRWTVPIVCGDTLNVEITVEATRRSRRGDRGIVTSSHSVRKQDSTEVLRFKTARLILARSAAET